MARVSDPTPETVLVFGEALFDVFPDGQQVLGGAPFNVAWNLHQLGESTCFVGGVGDDDAGARIRSAMRAIGMDERGLYEHPTAPTGRVEITLEQGEPSYDIVPGQAYDDVPASWVEALPAAAALLYHGSLALRSGNHPLLDHLRGCAQRRFVDVNLRAPWYSLDDVHAWLHGADVVKLNRDELDELMPESAPQQRARDLLRQGQIREAVIVTLGAEGAEVHTPQGDVVKAPAPEVVDFRDAVGAGDAFASVTIIGLVHGWPTQLTLDRALDFAARVCTLQGATSQDAAFYQAARAAWH